MKAAAVFHTAPEKSEIREINLASLKDNEVLIKTRYSAISPGTEAMIYRGKMPRGMTGDCTIASLGGVLEYPFSYGYSLVGTIVNCGKSVDPGWLNKRVFAFHPHQSRTIMRLEECLAIPDDVTSQDALFLPNMESALNFVMDGNPIFGSRVIVFGLGVVGLLTCKLLDKIPLTELIAVDPLDYRRQQRPKTNRSDVLDPFNESQWQNLIARLFSHNNDSGGFDVAFELSGNLKALNQAIEVTGFSGTIVLGSWYGNQSQSVNLGSHFHRRRINLVSSQVSTLQPRLTGRWTKSRRIDLAWKMIRDTRPASLITHRFSLSDCDRAFQITSERLENSLQVIFDYS